VRDYETLEALADRLLALSRNEREYQQLHNWRQRPLPRHFVANMELAFNTGEYYGERDMRQNPCRLCDRVAAIMMTRK